MKSRWLFELCSLALCTALIVVVKKVLDAIPNVEGVTFLIILFTLFFGWKTIFPVVIYIFEEGLYWGFGFWFPFYCIIWPLLVVLVLLFRRLLKTSAIGWALFSGLFVLVFDGVYALTMYPMGGWKIVWATIVSGVGFGVVHMIANFLICLALFTPLYRVMERLTKPVFDPIIKEESTSERGSNA